MIASFFTFSKRSNSTLLPTGSGEELEVLLKDASSILEPSIEIQSYHDPSSYNYCYIPDFGRYYFLEDWTYYRGVWTCRGSVDVLASWNSYILQTTAMVAFSSSSYNKLATDNRIAATAGEDRQVTTALFSGYLGNQQLVPSGWFALCVLDNTSQWGTGTSTTYFMTYQQMQMFCRELLQPDIWEQLVQWFGNPMEGILECYYLPIDISQYLDLTVDHAITIGDTALSAEGKTAQATNMAVKSKNAIIEIPWRYDDFRRLPPYSEITLYVPYCGAKTIPVELVSDVEAVLVDYSVDPTSGNVQAIAYVKQEILAEFSGNIKVSLPVGRSSRIESIVKSFGGGATAIVGAASGNPVMAATGIASAISSIASPATYQMCGGMNGSILGAILGGDVSRWQQFHLVCTSRDTTDTPDNLRPVVGNALYKAVSLSSLTGYCQTMGASVSAPCTAQERNNMNSMLDSGIYIE